tara:strand:+ start:762 stop:1349 length:588 start_codon:yes stop_codon:yes gene_type:complete
MLINAKVYKDITHREILYMVIKLITGTLFVFFLAACSTNPKDTADSSGTGSSSSSSDVSSSGEGSITETSPDSASIEPGSQEDLIVNVGDRVFFNYDSSELDSDAQELLQDQVAWLKQYSDVSIIVEGHCDERGTREYNLALGEKRAQSVKNYLIGLGISSDRVSTISYGKERPAVVGSNDGAWAQNRRSVTIVN